ncbi:hypothetical protein LTR22_025557 [Elasticomyces elasticus]|nr:hypothetical protein LTR22_025557 [Elasticomyces elasticus]KAK4907079.1 hypothetical protein LTR49_023872 [Elasticomyces elasticus]KAK5741126.1 hypothetical protein LTS12_024707 [Elasticomyces elasticus]
MPNALKWAVRLMFILGILVTIVVGFSVADFDAAFETELALSGPIGPAVQIVHNATQESLPWTTSLVALVLVSMLPSCLNAFTAASRQLWAFASDQGLPYSDWIASVKGGQPTKALLLTAILPVFLPVLNLGSPIALNAVISLVIIALISSYMLVATTSLYARCKGWKLYEKSDCYNARYYLGHWKGYSVDIFSIVALSIGFVIALLVQGSLT